jgi:hypothetical protein
MSWAGRAREWLFRSGALGDARAAAGELGRQMRARAQAKLLLEIARRVEGPADPLPWGSRPAARLVLYREAVRVALLSAGTADDEEAERAEMPALWSAAPSKLLAAAGDEATLEAVRHALCDAPGAVPLAVRDDEAERIGGFARALVAGLEVPQRRVDRILVQRWSRIALVAVAVVAAVVGLRALFESPNLIAGRPFRTSSSWAGCAADPPCKVLLFHTEHEQNPWVEYDLGARKRIHQIEVENRHDCCGDRAVPLAAEVSDDRVTWTEVGRREFEFVDWTLTFPARTARYVRLRALKVTALHLRRVAVR